MAANTLSNLYDEKKIRQFEKEFKYRMPREYLKRWLCMTDTGKRRKTGQLYQLNKYEAWAVMLSRMYVKFAQDPSDPALDDDHTAAIEFCGEMSCTDFWRCSGASIDFGIFYNELEERYWDELEIKECDAGVDYQGFSVYLNYIAHCYNEMSAKMALEIHAYLKKRELPDLWPEGTRSISFQVRNGDDFEFLGEEGSLLTFTCCYHFQDMSYPQIVLEQDSDLYFYNPDGSIEIAPKLSAAYRTSWEEAKKKSDSEFIKLNGERHDLEDKLSVNKNKLNYYEEHSGPEKNDDFKSILRDLWYLLPVAIMFCIGYFALGAVGEWLWRWSWVARTVTGCVLAFGTLIERDLYTDLEDLCHILSGAERRKVQERMDSIRKELPELQEETERIKQRLDELPDCCKAAQESYYPEQKFGEKWQDAWIDDLRGSDWAGSRYYVDAPNS